MKKEYFFQAQSPEWFKVRSKCITGTEVASLFAFNQYKSAVKLQEEKTSGKSDKIDDNVFMRAGRLFESSVLVALDEIGIHCEPAAPHKQVSVFQKGKRSVSLDAINRDQKYLVECKTTISPSKFQKWEDKDLSIPYLLQVHSGLDIIGYDYGYLACLGIFDPFPLQVFKVAHNKELSKIIVDTIDRFWDNISNGEKYKVNQADKKRVLELLPSTVTHVYPKI